ncbi:MAG: dockerin type I repeat-containing protein [Ruminococcus sp.]|nr:dockerin type I repeat-containing protein [Ruminococcus sp.]
MFKKTISIVLVLITILSVISVAGFSASAEEISEVLATADEATQDEAKLVMSSEPKVDASSVNGTVIGYIGDANLDGKINIKDCTAIQKYLAKYTLLNEQAKLLSDADNNQKLNVRDATAIQKYVAGMKVESVVWHLLYETGTHVHNYVEEVVEAKCETDGYTLRSCICGEEVKENVIKAQGHDYKIKRVDATCVDEGYTLYSCKNCSYSYKNNVIDATGAHKYENGACKVCNIKSFDVLKNYVKANGSIEKETGSYFIILDTGYSTDAATLLYNEAENAIGFGYTGLYKDIPGVISIAITPKESVFGFYMYYHETFESAGTYEISKFSRNVKEIDNIEFYFYDDYSESAAHKLTLDYIGTAFAAYEINESELPVTLKDLGFAKFNYR